MAASRSANDADFLIDAGLDPSAADAIRVLLEEAFARGAAGGASKMDQVFSAGEGRKVATRFAKGLNDALKQQVAAGAKSAADEMKSAMNAASKEAYNLTRALQLAGNEAKVIAANQYRARSETRAAAITEREIISREAQAKLEIQRGLNSRLAIEAQRAAQSQIVAQRSAGKVRVALTQATLQTIGRLEKGLAAAATGAAKTATSAIGKVYATLTATLRRNNAAFNDGLSTALRTRETTINNSFSRQEKELRQSVLRQERQLTLLRQRTSSGVLGAVTGRGVGIGVAGLVGGVGIAQLAAAGYADAVNFGEQVNKNRVVFGDFSKDVLAFAAQAPKLLGSTSAAALEATGTFGNLFRSLGVGQTQAGLFSIALTQTAADLSSFNNVPVEDVFLALRSGLVGESEPLRKFGIDVSDARLRHEAFLLGISDGKSVLTAAQKVQAAYSAIIKDSTLAQGDFARTADQGANAARIRQASILQLVSTLERKFLPVVTAVNRTLSATAQGLTAFVDGKVSGALLIVRDALKGAAAGLAAVLAVKGGVEVFKTLAVASKLLLTPLGTVLVVAGLLGAAISVLTSRSPALRQALGQLVDRLSVVGGRIREVVQPAVEWLSGFINDTAIPAIASFADFLGTHLLGALDATIGFITGTAIPAVVTFAGVVSEKLGLAWDFVSEKVGGFIEKVRPFLQPAIDGFSKLGEAIGSAFGGDFSGISSGASSALSGVGATVASLAGAVGKALLPVAQEVINFLLDLFSAPNLKRYASAFLGFVEEVGRILGTIASSPILVKVAAGLAAAAAILAFSFLKGFVSGVIDNIPGLFDLLGEALVAGLGLAFDNILEIVLLGAAFAGLAQRLFGKFRGAGESAGLGFAQGFKAKAVAGQGFLSGLFGGSGTAADKAKRDLKKQLGEINREVVALGGKRLVLGFNLNDASIGRARDSLDKLKSGFTDAEIAGRLFRQRILDGFKAVDKASAGVGRAMKGVAQIIAAPFKAAGQGGVFNQFGGLAGTTFTKSLVASLRAGGGNIKAGLTAAFAGLKDYAKAQGISVMAAFGDALAKGAQVALAGLGGFAAGKSAGAGGGNILFTALTSGLAGLAVGGPVVGAVAAGAAVIGGAFGAAGRNADEMRKRVKELTSTLKNDFVRAAEEGVVSAIRLGKGLLDFTDAAKLGSFSQSVADALGDDGIAAMARFGLTFEKDLLPIFSSGGPLDEMKSRLRLVFVDAAAATDEFQQKFGANTDRVKKYLAEVLKPGELSNEAVREFQDLKPILIAEKDYLDSIIDSAGDLTTVAGDTAKAIENINNISKAFGTDVDPTSATNAISTLEARYAGLGVIIAGIDAQTKAFFNPDYTSNQSLIDQAAITAAGLGQQRQSVRESDSPVQQAQLNQINDQIAATIGNALSVGVETGAVIDEATAKAFVQPIIDAYVAGITDPKEAALVREFLEGQVGKIVPNIDNRNAATQGQATIDEIQAVLDGAPPELKVSIATATLLADAGLTVANVQEYIANNPAVASLTFDQAAAQLAAINMNNEFVSVFSRQIPPSALYPTYDKGRINQDAVTAGQQVSQGFAAGITSQEYLAIRAASDLAAKATNAAKFKLKISSPSKVFMQLGQFVSEGLAVGIADGANTAEQAVTAAIDRLLTAARSGGSKVNDALRAAGVGLFGALTGSGAALNLSSPVTSAQSAITTAVQSLLSTFDSNTTTVFDVARKKASDRSNADNNIFGESLFSLNAADVIGASNLAALTGAFDAIAALGEVLLAQGEDAESVAAKLQAEVDALIKSATGLGFNAGEVSALADSLGLSGSALADFLDQLTQLKVEAQQSTLPTVATPLAKQRTSGQKRIEGGITNNIYLPSGNPEAAALAVANRQASQLWG